MEAKEPLSSKIKAIASSWRFIVLALFLISSLIAINPTTSTEGIVIQGVAPLSAASDAGIKVSSNSALRSLEEIYTINGATIKNSEDYFNAIQESQESIIILTNKDTYAIEINTTKNQSKQEAVGITIRDKVATNIKLGIELEGGSRLILQPEKQLSGEEFELLITSLQNRLDLYGASGTKVNKIEDSLSGEQFVIVESTFSNKNEIFELLQRQGNFEAKFSNTTVFTGNEVTRVLNDPQHSFLQQCNQNIQGEHVCSYVFSILINNQGATQFLDYASELPTSAGQLSEEIAFYLDGELITQLSVASEFKYKKINTPQITVSGNPMPTQAEAIESAKEEVKFLQAILSTQSLPTELEVVQSYSISSTQGEEFLSNALWVGLLSLTLVSLTVAIRYKRPAIFVSIFIALIGEIIIIFGFAALLKLTIDLAAIGGLIAAIGTGVDDQIIITDEYFRKHKKSISSKQKIKKAFAIVLLAYATTVAAMWPLSPMWVFESIKLLEGFAFMIIAGVTIGVLITRPAFAAMLRIFLTTKEEREKEAEEEE